MDLNAVLEALKTNGDEQTKKMLAKHGAKEPFFGVKVAFLKQLQKKIKKDHNLALELYNTGNSDAMYLAGLIADEKQMDKATLNKWADHAYWYWLSEYAVAWVTAESTFGYELALEWIDSDKEHIASAGWATLSCIVSVSDDNQLDIPGLTSLLDKIEAQIHSSANRVRYTMNGFVIGVGTYVASLTEKAMEVAANIGKVDVDMGGTACKVPLATTYIQKMIDREAIGKKRKAVRC